MKKLLVVKQKGTQLYLNVTEESGIVKNPVPILWFNEGLYGWIPVEVVRNEIEDWKDKSRVPIVYSPSERRIKIVWGQVKQLTFDVGKILMSFAEE